VLLKRETDIAEVQGRLPAMARAAVAAAAAAEAKRPRGQG
jgi:hypothetical protein